jgi:hypothetical protein
LGKQSNEDTSLSKSSTDVSFGASELKQYVIELLPALSITALILVSIFNIGYFSNIGLHFLGLIDFTNIVYSIGLVFAGLVLIANLLGAIIDVSIKLARDVDAANRLGRWVRICLDF